MNVVLFHGTSDSPELYWFPWLKKELEAAGHAVQATHYEDMNQVSIDEFLPKVTNDIELTEDTVLVGHSAGCPLILSLLEQAKTKIAKAVLVAGLCEEIPGDTNPVLQPSYDWDTIRDHAESFVFFNSDNDPWGCTDTQGRKMFDNLGGTLIIRHEGHFGSKTHNQPYKEFPLLRDVVLEPNI